MPTSSTDRRRPREANSVDPNSRESVADIISALAEPLMAAGFTPSDLCEISKTAFVRAAARVCRLGNGRLNLSRIAVVTGLTRQETARICNLASHGNAHTRATRLERLMHSWKSDSEFATAQGHPRKLPLTGRNRSFHALVKRYGGDVTARAVLEELTRRNAVRLIGGFVVPLAKKSPGIQSASRVIREMAPHVTALVNAISDAPHSKSSSAFIAEVPARSASERSLMLQKVNSVLGAAFESVGVLGNKVSKPRQVFKQKKILVFAVIR